MNCILCKNPKLIFCDFESEYCIFHYSEEILIQCVICHTIKLCKRNLSRCHECRFTTRKKYPIIIKTYIFDPKL